MAEQKPPLLSDTITGMLVFAVFLILLTCAIAHFSEDRTPKPFNLNKICLDGQAYRISKSNTGTGEPEHTLIRLWQDGKAVTCVNQLELALAPESRKDMR